MIVVKRLFFILLPALLLQLNISFPCRTEAAGGTHRSPVWASASPAALFHVAAAGGAEFANAARGMEPRPAPGMREEESSPWKKSDPISRKYAARQRPGSDVPLTRPDRPWKSEELTTLGIGLSIGDVDGDGKNEIVVIDPSTVYVYSLIDGKLGLLTQHSVRPLELKSVDVASIRKQGPDRIYLSAQNRGSVASLVLEYRNGTLVPVIQDSPYFLRVIHYPTRGPILLGQKRGFNNMYEGYIYRLVDKGDDLEAQDRFGVPLKIPIFGFTIGDFVGDSKPLIAVYDRADHLRIYSPTGKRLFKSSSYYGGSDVILRQAGPEIELKESYGEMREVVFFRPRIMSLRLGEDRAYQILAVTHDSKTMRVMSRTKMLQEGQVVGLVWTGDSMEDKWSTPRVQGVVSDFAVGTLPGFPGRRLITLERKNTDWMSFLRSRSQIRIYDLDAVIKAGLQDSGKRSDD